MAFRSLFLVLFLLGLGGCATVPKVKPPVPADLPLSSLCQKYAMDCRSDGLAQTVTLSYKATKIQGLIGSNIVMVGETKILLSAPLRRYKGMVMVPPDFERAVIGPTASPLSGAPLALPRRISKVVVDAGHGGKDPGAIGFSKTKEKDIDLDIARRVRDGLAKSGVDVIMTRDKDEFISLADRTEIASQRNVELFVSIHANSNKTRRAHGIEVYYIGALNKEDQSEEQRRMNEKKLCGLLQMKNSSEDVRKIALNMLYNHKLTVGPGLADRLARELGQELRESSRGSKPQRFYVLRNTLIPAVLVEVGFLSNPQDEKGLKDPGYRQQIADAIVQSIVGYLYAKGI
jgi:N-acetylmuramoyl-L-alanine amidase